MDIGMAFDIIIMATGVYMMYWGVTMKRSNQIPQVLVGKGFNLKTAKDPEGFIKATFPYTIGLGALLFITGIIGGLNLFATIPFVQTGISFAVVVVILLYGKFLMKAQMKYLVGAQTIAEKSKKRR